MSIKEEHILNALKVVQDPDLGRDIVSLGFIKNIEIKDRKVSLDLELTTPACPVKEDLKRQCEEQILNLEGMDEAEIRLTAQPRKSLHTQHECLQKVGSIIAVSSCKGGVGKSTVSTNLSIALHNSGAKVGLLDADIYGPSQPTLLGVANQRPFVENERFQPIEVCGIKMMSAGFLFPQGDAAVLRGPMVSNVLQQILFLTDWKELDYLVIDMPPGTGDVQLTLTQSLSLNGALIVTTPQKISLIDVGKGINMFSKVNVPILGLVENMSHFICDQCDKKHALLGPSGTPHLADTYGLDILAELPFESLTTTSSDQGQPLAADITSTAAQRYGELAGKVVSELAKTQHQNQFIPQVDIKW